METILLYIGGTSVVAVFLLNLLKKWIKDVVSPRWGDLGVQAALLAISFALAGIGKAMDLLPPEGLKLIGAIYTGAILIYQILIKSVYQKLLLNQLDPDDK